MNSAHLRLYPFQADWKLLQNENDEVHTHPNKHHWFWRKVWNPTRQLFYKQRPKSKHACLQVASDNLCLGATVVALFQTLLLCEIMSFPYYIMSLPHTPLHVTTALNLLLADFFLISYLSNNISISHFKHTHSHIMGRNPLFPGWLSLFLPHNDWPIRDQTFFQTCGGGGNFLQQWLP